MKQKNIATIKPETEKRFINTITGNAAFVFSFKYVMVFKNWLIVSGHEPATSQKQEWFTASFLNISPDDSLTAFENRELSRV